jgi:quercetin dioxygenase-like cupin family protein
MAVNRWNTTIDGEFSEEALRAKLESLGYVVARYTYPPGTVFPDHRHGIDKIDAVVSGRFRLVIGGHLALLGPGDWVSVPRGAVHNAAVVGDEPVISLDALRHESTDRSGQAVKVE